MLTEDDAINWLQGLEGFKKERYDLVGVSNLLDCLNRPDLNFKIIHIAGTNGKGSVARFCSSILIESGKKTGLFISPHVIEFNERIQVNGEFIKNCELLELIKAIKPLVERLKQNGIFCSQFDVITAIALEYFKQLDCEVVVLEAGMGGRLDSTNAILKSEMAILTKISLDHVKELGSNLKEIAFEKAEIVREDGICVCSAFEPFEVFEVIGEVCERKHAKLIRACDAVGAVCNFDSVLFEVKGCGRFELGVRGSFQVENATIAISAMLEFGVKLGCLKTALKKARWPARFEIFDKRPVIILDGAHNPDGVKSLKKSLSVCDLEPKIGVISMLSTKDYIEALKETVDIGFSVLILTQMRGSCVVPAEKLSYSAEKLGFNCMVERDIFKAIGLAKSLAGKNGVVVIYGSLYFASQIRDKLFD